MILRYFYLDGYNSVAQNLDVNLGGKYKFYFLRDKKTLNIVEDNMYVNNLYKDYSVISDISAILGKNSAGKTTVLRMINSVFNGFSRKEKYIVLFETEDKFILYTNFESLLFEATKLCKKLQFIKKADFNPIDELQNVGLIYFSNIFDKATPFQGNANLIDISINFTFENFYKENFKNGIKRKDDKNNIMLDYKASCMLQEIDFMIDMDRESNKDVSLLFEIPKQIDIGFVQNVPNYKDEAFCDNIEYNEILIRLYDAWNTYLVEEQEGNVKLFQNEVLFYLLFDFIYQLCKDGDYSEISAVKYWKEKTEARDWNLIDYYLQILDKLQNTSIVEDVVDELLVDNIEKEEIDYEDILDDLIWIEDTLVELKNIELDIIIKKIMRIADFVLIRSLIDKNIICEYLNQALYLLKELQEDLTCNDYDMYNLSYIYDSAEYVEKVYDLVVNNVDIEHIDRIHETDNDIEIQKLEIGIDADIEQKLQLLKRVIDKFIDFTGRYEYEANNNMLCMRLDNQEILEFIYEFKDLNSETIELDVNRNDISSGHSAYLDMCARINLARKSGEIRNKENVILLIDEGDIYLHPEKQLAYLNNLLKLLQILYVDKKVQVIITSNSPFIVSDVQTSNILYLENVDGKINIAKSSISNTFASNINTLLLDSFFIQNGLIGQFAFEKINRILKEICDGNISDENFKYIKDVIGIIGEPIIRRKLEHMLFHNSRSSNLQRELEYYKEKLAYIERLRGDKND